ncbi:MAG: hypothetical protein V2A58_04275 [Planctomycetota bacterium]
MRRIVAVALLALAGALSEGRAESPAPGNMQGTGEGVKRITKMYFMVHFRGYENDPGFKYYGWWKASGEKAWERWKEAMKGSGEETIFVIIPPRPMNAAVVEMMDFAREALGPRCVVISRSLVSCFEKEFREGRAGEMGWVPLGDDFLRGLGDEVMELLSSRGDDWPHEDLTTWVQACAYAQDLTEALRARGYAYDGQTVEAEAGGDAFGGCLLKYACTLGRRLGFARGVRLNGDLSAEMPLPALGSRFAGSQRLGEGILAYLWESRDGRPIATFGEEFHSPADGPRFVKVPVDPWMVELEAGPEVRSALVAGGVRAPVGVGIQPHVMEVIRGREGMTVAEMRRACLLAAVTNETESAGAPRSPAADGINLLWNPSFEVGEAGLLPYRPWVFGQREGEGWVWDRVGVAWNAIGGPGGGQMAVVNMEGGKEILIEAATRLPRDLTKRARFSIRMRAEPSIERVDVGLHFGDGKRWVVRKEESFAAGGEWERREVELEMKEAQLGEEVVETYLKGIVHIQPPGGRVFLDDAAIMVIGTGK